MNYKTGFEKFYTNSFPGSLFFLPPGARKRGLSILISTVLPVYWYVYTCHYKLQVNSRSHLFWPESSMSIDIALLFHDRYSLTILVFSKRSVIFKKTAVSLVLLVGTSF